jgi:hypothetical protein
MFGYYRLLVLYPVNVMAGSVNEHSAPDARMPYKCQISASGVLILDCDDVKLEIISGKWNMVGNCSCY